MPAGNSLRPVPDEPTSGARSSEHEDATWVDSFLATRPGKTYEVDVHDDAHQAAGREAVESVARDFTDDIVRRADDAANAHDAAADETETLQPEQD